MMPFKNPLTPYGQDVIVGAMVTSRGRHGVGQPVVCGKVESIDGQMVTVRIHEYGKPSYTRTRTINKLRVL
jgi:hypothetical protein